jgi:hypothetical protein
MSCDTIQAWNIRPSTPDRHSWLSPEFIESSLIFIYGSTNIFLEHLAGWGNAWTARDLEHVSITVLFIGGGLVSFGFSGWIDDLQFLHELTVAIV